MALTRYVLRVDIDGPMSNSEQEAFVDDVATRVSDYDIGGTFIGGHGWGWLDFEGDEESVEAVLGEIIDDSRVLDHEVLKQTSPNARTFEHWFAAFEGNPSDPGEVNWFQSAT
ncbi:MAG: BLUF domain-containing protein [Bradymonadaceae bacterium]